MIFIQTLYFKFTGHEESKYIFTTLMGAENEAIGRVGSGIAELITAILILYPRTVVFGTLASLGLISGAIISHLTVLGIVVNNDSGFLFILAFTIFVLAWVVLYVHRRELPVVGNSF